MAINPTSGTIAGIKLKELDEPTYIDMIAVDVYVNIIQQQINNLYKRIDSPASSLTPEQKGALLDELLLNKLREKARQYRPESQGTSLQSKIFWAAIGFLTASLCFAMYHWKICRRLSIS